MIVYPQLLNPSTVKPLNHASLKKCVAFTLAEVLITLGIIGVVAAMTLPAILNNIRYRELQTRFKKAYSVLQNIHIRVVEEHSGVYDNFINAPQSQELRTKQIESMAKYLNGAKICHWKGAFQNCSNRGVVKTYMNYTGDTAAHIVADSTSELAIQTVDGMTIFLGGQVYNQNRIYVDTNGTTEGPNRLGFDLFVFIIDKNDKITGESITSTIYGKPEEKTYPCSSVNASRPAYNGMGCTYYALNDINPDNSSLRYWSNLPK